MNKGYTCYSGFAVSWSQVNFKPFLIRNAFVVSNSVRIILLQFSKLCFKCPSFSFEIFIKQDIIFLQISAVQTCPLWYPLKFSMTNSLMSGLKWAHKSRNGKKKSPHFILIASFELHAQQQSQTPWHRFLKAWNTDDRFPLWMRGFVWLIVFQETMSVLYKWLL